MARPIPIGVRGEAEETVELKHTLAASHPDLPPVYSTPDMIRLMEIACFNALQPFCDDGEITVGVSIHIEHRAASEIGMRIRAEAELESFDGRFYTMRVTAHERHSADRGPQHARSSRDGVIGRDGVEIGRGTVGRAVVHVPTFLARLRQKAQTQATAAKGAGAKDTHRRAEASKEC